MCSAKPAAAQSSTAVPTPMNTHRIRSRRPCRRRNAAMIPAMRAASRPSRSPMTKGGSIAVLKVGKANLTTVTDYVVDVRIDLNADLGEGFGAWRLGDDAALLEVVTSANVACGFHAGDPTTMARVCTAAAARGVVIGAQVGYRDLAGFGR